MPPVDALIRRTAVVEIRLSINLNIGLVSRRWEIIRKIRSIAVSCKEYAAVGIYSDQRNVHVVERKRRIIWIMTFLDM